MAIPKFLMKKGEVTIDIFTTYGIRVEDFPYLPLKTQPKNIVTRKYLDQDGDYEYVPTTLYYEPQKFTITFVYKGATNAADTNIKNFLDYLRGAEISMYSEHAKVGRQKCRLESISETPFLYRAKKDVVHIALTFKCNDPSTNITLSLA